MYVQFNFWLCFNVCVRTTTLTSPQGWIKCYVTHLLHLFVFRIYIVCGFEEEDSLENLRILSCFVWKKKSVLFNLLCVFAQTKPCFCQPYTQNYSMTPKQTPPLLLPPPTPHVEWLELTELRQARAAARVEVSTKRPVLSHRTFEISETELKRSLSTMLSSDTTEKQTDKEAKLKKSMFSS